VKALGDEEKRSLLEAVAKTVDAGSRNNRSDFFAQPSAFSDCAAKSDTHFLLRRQDHSLKADVTKALEQRTG
jgi:hypothetical protein